MIDAAFVNATLVNGRCQDDFLQKSHPGAITVPPALAVAEAEGRSGAEASAPGALDPQRAVDPLRGELFLQRVLAEALA